MPAHKQQRRHFAQTTAAVRGLTGLWHSVALAFQVKMSGCPPELGGTVGYAGYFVISLMTDAGIGHPT